MHELSRQQLEFLEALLNEQRKRLLDEIRQELKASGEENFNQIAGSVHDLGDESVAGLINDLNAKHLHRHLKEVNQIDQAFNRIQRNEYGICQDCGDQIGFERLKASPSAYRCFDCQSQYEHSHMAEEGGSL